MKDKPVVDKINKLSIFVLLFAIFQLSTLVSTFSYEVVLPFQVTLPHESQVVLKHILKLVEQKRIKV